MTNVINSKIDLRLGPFLYKKSFIYNSKQYHERFSSFLVNSNKYYVIQCEKGSQMHHDSH